MYFSNLTLDFVEVFDVSLDVIYLVELSEVDTLQQLADSCVHFSFISVLTFGLLFLL